MLHGIGHSKHVSKAIFSETYRGLVNHPLGYNMEIPDLLGDMEHLTIEDVPKEETPAGMMGDMMEKTLG